MDVDALYAFSEFDTKTQQCFSYKFFPQNINMYNVHNILYSCKLSSIPKDSPCGYANMYVYMRAFCVECNALFVRLYLCLVFGGTWACETKSAYTPNKFVCKFHTNNIRESWIRKYVVRIFVIFTNIFFPTKNTFSVRMICNIHEHNFEPNIFNHSHWYLRTILCTYNTRISL